MTKDKDTER